MAAFIYLGNVFLYFLTLAPKGAVGNVQQNITNPECKDDENYETYCKEYRLNDFCNSYPYGMHRHCALTCGFCKCKAKIDIGFLVDSSASIEKAGKGNYKKCLDFIQNAINGSFISEEFTHVGLVLYSARVETVYDFKKFYDPEAMMNATAEAKYLRGSTKTGKALKYTKTELFDKSSRKGVPKVLIVLTDGKSKDAVKGPADQLKAANITVFAIGVGRKYDIAQLIDIASKPDRKYALTADFNNLKDLYTSIRDDACRVNSTLKASDIPANHLPHRSVSTSPTVFGAQGSNEMTQQVTVLKARTHVERIP